MQRLLTTTETTARKSSSTSKNKTALKIIGSFACASIVAVALVNGGRTSNNNASSTMARLGSSSSRSMIFAPRQALLGSTAEHKSHRQDHTASETEKNADNEANEKVEAAKGVFDQAKDMFNSFMHSKPIDEIAEASEEFIEEVTDETEKLTDELDLTGGDEDLTKKEKKLKHQYYLLNGTSMLYGLMTKDTLTDGSLLLLI